eukprot:Colp12_sorted_trinity150504_noHs@25937
MRTSVVLALAALFVACARADLDWPEMSKKFPRYAMYAGAVYCDPVDIQAWNCSRCAALPEFTPIGVADDATTKMQAMVGVSHANQTIMVVFRGTVFIEIENWIKNLDAFRTPLKWNNIPEGAEVHEGFLKAYKSLKSRLIDNYIGLVKAHPTYQTVVIGHSLGGALATVCGLDLIANHGIRSQIVSFGSPRVFNSILASYMNSIIDSYRVVNYNDIVPHLPTIDMGFSHVAVETWIHQNGTLIECNYAGEDEDCSMSLSILKLAVQPHLHYLGATLNRYC